MGLMHLKKSFFLSATIRRKFAIGLIGSLATLIETPVLAAWGLGFGYHNPLSSDLGVSALYKGKSFGFEAAVGAANLWNDDSNTGAEFGGDLDLKLFLGTSIDIYLEAGLNFGLGASTEGAGIRIGQGGLFAGGGVLLEGRSLYGLLGGDYIFDSSEARLTATLGFWL